MTQQSAIAIINEIRSHAVSKTAMKIGTEEHIQSMSINISSVYNIKLIIWLAPKANELGRKIPNKNQFEVELGSDLSKAGMILDAFRSYKVQELDSSVFNQPAAAGW